MFYLKVSALQLCCLTFVVLIQSGQSFISKRARHPTSCGSHGHLSGSHCVCNHGYTGTVCDKMNCQHGGQFDSHHMRCVCHNGYYGTFCEHKKLSCQHGGTFSTHYGKCLCKPDYSGSLCEIVSPSLVCKSNPCVHGHCYHDNTNYFCACSAGYIGRHCTEHVHITHIVTPCTSGPCLNQGHCYDDNTTYICICKDGFDGTNCEIGLTTAKEMLQPLTMGPVFGEITPPDTTTEILQTTTSLPTTPGYPKCNHTQVVAGLATGRADHPDARPCPDNDFGENKKSDAIVMQFCGAPNVTLWEKSVQVLEYCNSIPKYTPIAQWHNGYVTSKTGVFLSCNEADSFQYFTQTCDEIYKLTNMTWPESESFHVIGY